MGIINKGCACKTSQKSQGTILKSLATKDPVVGSPVVVPGAAPGAGVEDLVGEVLGGHSCGSSSNSGIERSVASEESGSLRLGS